MPFDAKRSPVEPIESPIRSEELEPRTGPASKEKRRKPKIQRVEQDPSLLRDVFGWIAILVSIAWLLILISYDPTDPSPLSASVKVRPDNYLGHVGANIAAYSFQSFGFGNFLFPVSAIYLGFLCIRVRRVNDWFFQIAGGGTAIFAFLIFLGSFETVTFKGEDLIPGGIVGVVLWSFFSGHLNPVGTYLFLVGITGLALLVSTRLTLKQIGGGLLIALRWLSGYLMRFARWIRAYLEETKREKAQHRIIERELDKITEHQVRPQGRRGGQVTANLEEPGGRALIHPKPGGNYIPSEDLTTDLMQTQ